LVRKLLLGLLLGQHRRDSRGAANPDRAHGQLDRHVLRCARRDVAGHEAHRPLGHVGDQGALAGVRIVDEFVDCDLAFRADGEDGFVQQQDLHAGIRPGLDGVFQEDGLAAVHLAPDRVGAGKLDVAPHGG
jgi:hypothetical protein